MKPWMLIAAFLAVFFYALVFRAPAATVYGWLTPDNQAIRLVGVEGSVRHGRAAGLVAGGKTLASGVEWTLSPLLLLSGRVGGEFSSAEGVISAGRLALGPGGARAQDLRATGSLKALLSAAGQAFVPVDGQFGLSLDRARFRDGFPSHLEGRLTVTSLNWSLGARPVPLGDFQAEVAPEDDELVAVISSLSGPTAVNGDARLRQDGGYRLDLRIKAEPGADPMITNLLSGLGEPDSEGFYALREAGSFDRPAPASANPDPAPDDEETDDE